MNAQLQQATVKQSKPFMPAPVLQRKCACGQHTVSGGECAECRKKRLQLQRGAVNQTRPTTAPPIVHEALRSPGSPLDSTTRTFMESSFDHDFSEVRVHTGAKAIKAAQAVNAFAYTVGRDVVFGAGQYAPDTGAGKRLLAHELSHVVQQRRAADTGLLVLHNPAGPAEQEANRVASKLGAVNVGETAQISVQRESPFDDPFSRRAGPPFEELPLPPRCSITWKDGKWSWKCEDLPKIGATPEIPLDPRDIPEWLKDLVPKKGDGKKRTFPVLPTPGTGLPPNWFEDLCKRNPLSPLCTVPGKKKVPGKKLDLTKPIGIFWTTDVHFEQNRPSPGERSPDGGLTADGLAAINTIAFLLRRDSTLRVRLIGRASSEGNTAYNLNLSRRRAQLVYQKLEEAKLDGQVMDPIKSDGKEAGCTQLQFGVWACGELGATQDEVRPEERKVGATFLRNPPLPSGPLKLTPPQFGRTESE